MCNHCGGKFVIQEPEAPSALKEWLDATVDDDLPATVVRSYAGRSQGDATSLFAREAELLAQRGYHPTAQSWADGRPGVARVLTVGLFASSLRPDGSLTVTFVRSAKPVEPLAQPDRRTKRCPDCAEDVMAEARICRYCRHEFAE
jgi:hypothetical protein